MKKFFWNNFIFLVPEMKYENKKYEDETGSDSREKQFWNFNMGGRGDNKNKEILKTMFEDKKETKTNFWNNTKKNKNIWIRVQVGDEKNKGLGGGAGREEKKKEK